MSYSIISTNRFEKELKRLAKKFPSLKNEYAELISAIEENPESGTFIGNNCYKIRLAISSKRKGKSGGILMYQKSTNVALFALEKAFKVIEAKSKIQD
jgi:mRNA-degrading endonuclease RelE of RelBE toxin-antitoxin system